MKGWEFFAFLFGSFSPRWGQRRQREKMFSVCLPVCVYDIPRRTEGNLMVWFITSIRRILRISPSGWSRSRRRRRRRDDRGIISLPFLHLCVCGRDYKSPVRPTDTQPVLEGLPQLSPQLAASPWQPEPGSRQVCRATQQNWSHSAVQNDLKTHSVAAVKQLKWYNN